MSFVPQPCGEEVPSSSVTVEPGNEPIAVYVVGPDPLPVSFEGGISVNLDCSTDSITVCPGDDPLEVVFNQTVTVQATDLDIRNLLFATDKIDVSGSSVTISDGSGPVTVDGTVALDSATLAALETTTVALTGAVEMRDQVLVPKGYQQLTPVVSTPLAVPVGAVYALLQARIGDISYRDDGVAPTTSVGMRIVLDNSLFYTGSLASLLFITAVGTLDVLYYGVS